MPIPINGPFRVKVITSLLIVSFCSQSTWAGYAIHEANGKTKTGKTVNSSQSYKTTRVGPGSLEEAGSAYASSTSTSTLTSAVDQGFSVSKFAFKSATLGISAAIGSIAATAGIGTAVVITGGIALGAIAAVALLGYGAKKIYDKYKSHLMGVPSEVSEALTVRAKRVGINSQTLIQNYLNKYLDQVCQANGYDRVNMNLTKTSRRRVNAKQYFKKNGVFTAYNIQGEPENYSYKKGYSHIVVNHLVCTNIEKEVTLDEKYSLMQEVLATSALSKPGQQSIPSHTSQGPSPSLVQVSDRIEKPSSFRSSTTASESTETRSQTASSASTAHTYRGKKIKTD